MSTNGYHSYYWNAPCCQAWKNFQMRQEYSQCHLILFLHWGLLLTPQREPLAPRTPLDYSLPCNLSLWRECRTLISFIQIDFACSHVLIPGASHVKRTRGWGETSKETEDLRLTQWERRRECVILKAAERLQMKATVNRPNAVRGWARWGPRIDDQIPQSGGHWWPGQKQPWCGGCETLIGVRHLIHQA